MKQYEHREKKQRAVVESKPTSNQSNRVDEKLGMIMAHLRALEQENQKLRIKVYRLQDEITAVKTYLTKRR